MTESTPPAPSIDPQEILGALPHRYPFLMVDRILEFEPEKRIVCIKNVTFNEPHFTGHFPDNPVMPGVLIAEALAQTGAILLLKSPRVREDYGDSLAVLTGIENAKFRRVVRPGDQLRLELEIERFRKGFGRSVGRATVNGDLAASMTISFALVNPDEMKL